jgi:hypothetical protein
LLRHGLSKRLLVVDLLHKVLGNFGRSFILAFICRFDLSSDDLSLAPLIGLPFVSIMIAAVLGSGAAETAAKLRFF